MEQKEILESVVRVAKEEIRVLEFLAKQAEQIEKFIQSYFCVNSDNTMALGARSALATCLKPVRASFKGIDGFLSRTQAEALAAKWNAGLTSDQGSCRVRVLSTSALWAGHQCNQLELVKFLEQGIAKLG